MEKLRKSLLEEKRVDIASFEVRANDGYNIGNGDAPINSDHKGKDSVPLTISDLVLRYVDENSDLLSKTTLYKQVGKYDLVLEAIAPAPAVPVREGATITSVDSPFHSVELSSYKFGERVKFTREAIEDVNFDIVKHITDLISVKMSKTVEKAIIQGVNDSGTVLCDGLLGCHIDENDIQYAKSTNTVGQGKIKVEDLIKAYYKLPHEMRKKSVLIVGSTVMEELRKMRDSRRYPFYFSEISKEARVNEFMGRPVISTDYLGSLEKTGDVVAIWVNLEKAMAVNIRQNVDINKYYELYAQDDMVGVHYTFRFDTKLMYNGAISLVKTGEIVVVPPITKMVVEQDIIEEKPKAKRTRKSKTE